MKKIVLTTIILMFTSLALGAGELANDKAIQSKMIESTSFLKSEFTRELKQSIGIEEFVLQVELKLDDQKLHETLGIKKETWGQMQDMSLPGLFVEEKKGFESPIHREIRKEQILMSLKKINVDIVYHQDNYTPEFIQRALKKVILFSIPNLKEHQIEITPVKEAAPYRDATPSAGEMISKVLKKPLEVNLMPSPFASFWNKYHKFMILGGVLLAFALGSLIALALRTSMGSLSEVIRSKTFSMGTAHQGPPSQKTEARPIAQKDQGKNDSFETYIHANEYLSTLIAKEVKIANEVLILKLLAEDFGSLIILLDVLPKDKREKFLESVDQDKKDRFKSFIVGQGTSALKDDSQLKEAAVQIIKLLKIAALSPDELYNIIVSDLVGQLSIQDLVLFFENARGRERAFVCEQLKPEQLVFLVQEGCLGHSDIDSDSTHLTKSELVDLIISISSSRRFKKNNVRRDRLEFIYAQVETDKAEILADAMGLEPQFRLEFLFTKFKEPALKYLEALDYESLSHLFPLLTATMREEVLKQQPELLAERLRFSKKIISAESLRLKGDFYFHLRTFSHEENDLTGIHRLIA